MPTKSGSAGVGAGDCSLGGSAGAGVCGISGAGSAGVGVSWISATNSACAGGCENSTGASMVCGADCAVAVTNSSGRDLSGVVVSTIFIGGFAARINSSAVTLIDSSWSARELTIS